MKLLKRLFKIYSPSYKEGAMITFIQEYCSQIPGVECAIDSIGNLYITKGKASSYPCVVAHLDQVQSNHSKDFVAVETKDIIFGYSPSNKRREGLGADDKNGIWIALKCLKKYDTLKVAFFVGEEVGCVGSSKACIEFFDDTRFVIQPDRRGCKDLVTSIGFTELCSKEFLDSTNYTDYGYEESDGMLTDVLSLKELGLPVSCINLSCGYYEPHTSNEFVVKDDLINCLALVEYIIENCTQPYPHQFKEGYGFYHYKNEDVEEAEFEIWTYLDYNYPIITNASELMEVFKHDYPSLTIDDYEKILEEHELYMSDCML